ncbi:hypothetical protein [Rhizobium rhizosphaerae]|uniref:hypothetical protein n=1 Tax=Xaviernesmea rhizosphaerae TaxID=1672749 RepID=UPI00117A3C17|nr:hypothetical protein [Xaviernesmea rhizosphaerae]
MTTTSASAPEAKHPTEKREAVFAEIRCEDRKLEQWTAHRFRSNALWVTERTQVEKAIVRSGWKRSLRTAMTALAKRMSIHGFASDMPVSPRIPLLNDGGGSRK